MWAIELIIYSFPAIAHLFIPLYFCGKVLNQVRKLLQLFAFALIFCTPLAAQAQEDFEKAHKASVPSDGDAKFRFVGYGEMAASYMDYDFNRVGPNGSGKMNRGIISIPRFVLAFDYKFSPKWVLSSEIEFEYGGTGAAREIEWVEENGEYEAEIEKGGEKRYEAYPECRIQIPGYDCYGRCALYPPRQFYFYCPGRFRMGDLKGSESLEDIAQAIVPVREPAYACL